MISDIIYVGRRISACLQLFTLLIFVAYKRLVSFSVSHYNDKRRHSSHGDDSWCLMSLTHTIYTLSDVSNIQICLTIVIYVKLMWSLRIYSVVNHEFATRMFPRWRYLPTYGRFACKKGNRSSYCTNVDSSWPSDAIWRHDSGLTFDQIRACCLMASSHHLNQCWLIMKGVLWYHLPATCISQRIA